ncbi:MAG: hypothetical protein IJY42_03380, partial [Clostridia bacterium]|nr:hypothetical protein [Clostridia bacterium]
MTTREYAQYAKEKGYDGVIFKNIIDNGAYASGADRFNPSTVAIAFESNQIKSVANEKPTDKADIRYSLSSDGEQPKAYGSYNVYGKDIALENQDIAPTQETITATETAESTMPTDFAPM